MKGRVVAGSIGAITLYAAASIFKRRNTRESKTGGKQSNRKRVGVNAECMYPP